MPGPVKAQDPVLANLRHRSPHSVRQPGFGEEKVQLHQSGEGFLDKGCHLSHPAGKLQEDAVHLLLLLPLKETDFVVGFHHRHGLHKDGGLGAGGVVDQTRQLPFALHFYRDNRPAVPDGDDSLLKHLGVLGAFDDALQLFPDGELGLSYFAADGGQLWGGGVLKLLVVQDAPVDFFLQSPVGGEGVKETVGIGGFLRLTPPVPDRPDGAKHPADG